MDSEFFYQKTRIKGFLISKKNLKPQPEVIYKIKSVVKLKLVLYLVISIELHAFLHFGAFSC